MSKGVNDSGYTPWEYDLTDVSLDKSAIRLGIDPQRASSLVGVDGNVEGGARVHPGFRRIANLGTTGSVDGYRTGGPAAWEAAVVASIGGSGYHDQRSDVIDFFPMTLYVEEGVYLYCFVYRVQRLGGGANDCDIFMDYVPIDSDVASVSWTGAVLLDTGIEYDAPMDVQVFGRFLYVLVKGEEPALHWWTVNGGSFDKNTVQPAGPGLPPEGSLVPDSTDAYFGTAGSGTTFCMFYDDLSTDACMPVSIDSHTDLADPADRPAYGRWWVGSGRTLTGGETVNEDSQDPAGTEILEGGYGLAYRLIDSTSGRKSALSEIVDLKSSDFPVNGSSVQQNHGMGFSIAYDSNRFDRLEIFRSVRVEDASGLYTARDLHPDRIVELADFDCTDTSLVGTDLLPTAGRFDPREDTTGIDTYAYHFIEITGGTDVIVATGDAAIYEIDGRDSDDQIELASEITITPSSPTDVTVGRIFIDGDDKTSVGTDSSITTTGGPTYTLSKASAGLFTAMPSGVPADKAYVELITGTGLTAGWYEISSKTDDDSVVLVNDPAGGGDPTDVAVGRIAWNSTDYNLTAQRWTTATKKLDSQTANDYAGYVAEGQPADTTDSLWRGAVYFYTLEDKVLAYKFPYVEDAFFDKTIPQGGVGMMYDNTLLLSQISSPGEPGNDQLFVGDQDRTSYDIRWSSLIDISPELFPPVNRYTPSQPGDVPLAMRMVAGNVLAFSKDRIFHIRKEGLYIRVYPIHQGYGVAGQYTLEVVGPTVYFINERGVKAIGPGGQLEDVRVLNRLISEEWQADLPDMSMAFDTAGSCLCMLNPNEEKIAMLWFNTGRVSEYWYAPFRLCRPGRWWREDDTSQIFEQRALFVKNPVRYSAGGDSTSGGTHAVYVMDTERIADNTGGGYNGGSTNAVRNLDWGGDNRVDTADVDTTVVSGSTSTWDFSGNALIQFDALELNGEYVWVTSCSDESFVGKKGRIHSSTVDTLTLISAQSLDLDGLPRDTSTRITIGPVYFEWVGTPLGVRSADGQIAGRTLRQVREAETIMPFFLDLDGAPVNNYPVDATFTGMLFKGSGLVADEEAKPRAFDGSAVQGIFDSEQVNPAAMGTESGAGRRGGVHGNILSPGLSVVCTDLDFTLVWVTVEGRMRGYTRTTRKTT